MFKEKKYIASLVIGMMICFASCTTEDDSDDVDPRLKFGGTWIANENSTVFGASAYQVTASNDTSNSSQILIYNFYNLGLGTPVRGIVSGNNLSIGSQQVSGQTISGSGTFASNNVNITFTANDGQVSDNVSLQLSRP